MWMWAADITVKEHTQTKLAGIGIRGLPWFVLPLIVIVAVVILLGVQKWLRHRCQPSDPSN